VHPGERPLRVLLPPPPLPRPQRLEPATPHITAYTVAPVQGGPQYPVLPSQYKVTPVQGSALNLQPPTSRHARWLRYKVVHSTLWLQYKLTPVQGSALNLRPRPPPPITASVQFHHSSCPGGAQQGMAGPALPSSVAEGRSYRT
jgi:hypothetical protein